jgi:hypothetical protein
MRWDGENMDKLTAASRSSSIPTTCTASARWLHALQDEKFLGFAQSMIGPDVVLHHTKLFQKPPRHGAPFPVHQDWSYFPTQNDSMVAATIFLGVMPTNSPAGCACSRVPQARAPEQLFGLRTFGDPQGVPAGKGHAHQRTPGRRRGRLRRRYRFAATCAGTRFRTLRLAETYAFQDRPA